MKKTLLTGGVLTAALHLAMAQPKLVAQKQWFTSSFSVLEGLVSKPTGAERERGTSTFPHLQDLMNAQIDNTNSYLSSLRATYSADSAKAVADDKAAKGEKVKALSDQQNAASLLRSGPNNPQYKAGFQKSQAAVSSASNNANKAAAELQALQKEAASIKYYSGVLQTQKTSVSRAAIAIQVLGMPHTPDVADEVKNLTNALSAFVSTL